MMGNMSESSNGAAPYAPSEGGSVHVNTTTYTTATTNAPTNESAKIASQLFRGSSCTRPPYWTRW